MFSDGKWLLCDSIYHKYINIKLGDSSNKNKQL